MNQRELELFILVCVLMDSPSLGESWYSSLEEEFFRDMEELFI
jgi:hypothetical protein